MQGNSRLDFDLHHTLLVFLSLFFFFPKKELIRTTCPMKWMKVQGRLGENPWTVTRLALKSQIEANDVERAIKTTLRLQLRTERQNKKIVASVQQPGPCPHHYRRYRPPRSTARRYSTAQTQQYRERRVDHEQRASHDRCDYPTSVS